MNLITFRQDKHIKPMVTELFHTQLLRYGIACQSVYAHVALSNQKSKHFFLSVLFSCNFMLIIIIIIIHLLLFVYLSILFFIFFNN